MTALRLTIENMTSLPDGGPLIYTLTGRRGIDIGRDAHLDWVLPDPAREVSGKHCEIRWQDGGYWLHDVSSNGTYLNGSDARLAEPRRLRNGDRLEIGRYLIAVSLSGEAEDAAPVAAPMAAPPAPATDLWGIAEEAAPPQVIARERKVRPLVDYDFIDSAADMPEPVADLDWARPPVAPAPVAPEPLPGPLPALLAQPEPAPEPVPAPAPVAAGGGADFIALFEAGAGLPAGSLASRPPEELAREIGKLMLVMTGELKMLMQARSDSKGAMRSANHTSVQALGNNPIPFAPTPEEALRLMLARQGRSYLGGEEALRKTFAALKAHQSDTFVAMQAALDGILAELDPATIEREAGPEGAVGQLLGARKARLWDAFRTRWQALGVSHAEGLRGVFMSLFTAQYDKRASRK